MKHQKARTIAVALVIGLVILTTALVFVPNDSFSIAQDQPEELVLPVVDYQAAGSADRDEKQKRTKRSKRYDRTSGESIKEADYAVERIWTAHWATDLPSLPVIQSDAILIGKVIDANAHLSSDKTGVYSEFAVEVERILKGFGMEALNSSVVPVERFGGAVRFPSGVIQKYRSNGQGTPREGRRYVLFLKNVDDDESFSLLTGYEIRGEKIVALDGSSHRGNLALQFDSYNGFNAAKFLDLLNEAISNNRSVSKLNQKCPLISAHVYIVCTLRFSRVCLRFVAIICTDRDVDAQTPPTDCPPIPPPQTCPSPLQTTTRQEAWPQGAVVTVNIDPSFSSQRAAAVEQAVRNWTNAGSSGVTFSSRIMQRHPR